MYATLHLSPNGEPTKSTAAADRTVDARTGTANATGTTNNHSVECTSVAAIGIDKVHWREQWVLQSTDGTNRSTTDDSPTEEKIRSPRHCRYVSAVCFNICVLIMCINYAAKS